MNHVEIVANTFGLPYDSNDPRNQDWELFVADSNRICDFLDGFNLLPTTASRHVLIEVLLASFEEAELAGTLNNTEWLRFWALIGSEIESCSHLLAYWTQLPSIGHLVLEQLRKVGYSVAEDHLSLYRPR